MDPPQTPLDKILEDFWRFYDETAPLLRQWGQNFVRNTENGFSRMTPKNWIRLTAAVGGYLLLRPYLMKLGAYLQNRQLDKMGKELEREHAEMDANDLRGKAKVKIPGVESDDDDEEEIIPEREWGRKARVRQRKIVRKAMERHEEMLSMVGHESDKDIEDLLED